MVGKRTLRETIGKKVHHCVIFHGHNHAVMKSEYSIFCNAN